MNKKEEEIQQKLIELEASVLDDEQRAVSRQDKNGNIYAVDTRSDAISSRSGKSGKAKKSDAAYFGGLALIFIGLVMVFQHIHVSSGLLAMLGMGSGGFALLFLPIMIGLGMIFYNSRSKWGWCLTVLGCAVTILATLATLTITFPGVTMMQIIIMFLPFAIGGALLVKGMGGPQGVIDTLKEQMPKRESTG
ncbi:MAG: hypothetical protein J0H83_06710 [Candidatus Melainabacteria bacterium]|jgi:hypothetical protein|nr:hypothetical protein [Candidatus Melainabacteria bacterium]